MLRDVQAEEANCCYDVGWNVAHVEFCPFSEGASLLAVVGEKTAILALNRTANGDEALETQAFCGVLDSPKGSAQAVAWGRSGDQLQLAAAGDCSVHVHNVSQEGASTCTSAGLPAELVGNGVYDCCYLPQGELFAVTGEACRCDILRMRGNAVSSHLGIDRSFPLQSEGVSVRAHADQPEHLMIAEADGTIHFVDLRAPNRCFPAISRSLPPAERAAAGLRDADWSPMDAHLVGAVAGARWYGWDLRHGGGSGGGGDATAHVGEAELHGALGFRWAPASARFAVIGRGPEGSVHTLRTGAGRDERGAWVVEPAQTVQVTHGLQTRISSISWRHHSVAGGGAWLAGSGDSKVCVWTLPKAT